MSKYFTFGMFDHQMMINLTWTEEINMSFHYVDCTGFDSGYFKRLKNLFEGYTSTPKLQEPYVITSVGEDGMLTLQYDVPGVGPDDVKVTSKNGTIRVSAKREGRNYSFKNYIKGFNEDSLEATLKHGVLTIKLTPEKKLIPKEFKVKLIE